MKPHERLYLQYRPSDDDGIDFLQSIQSALLRHNPQARSVQLTQLHLTIIHFGILADVFREIREANDALTWSVYEAAVRHFMLQSEPLLPEHTTVATVRLARFGANASVVALECITDGSLQAAHQASLEVLEDTLIACGIQHPRGFMQGSPNFRFALSFSPHISLLKAARALPQDMIHSYEGFDIRLERMPLRYI